MIKVKFIHAYTQGDPIDSEYVHIQVGELFNAYEVDLDGHVLIDTGDLIWIPNEYIEVIENA